MTMKITFHKTCTYVKTLESIKNTGKIYTENPSYCTNSLKKYLALMFLSTWWLRIVTKLLGTWSMLERRTGNAVYWDNNNYEKWGFLTKKSNGRHLTVQFNMSLGSTNTAMRLLKLQPNKISMFTGSLNLMVIINSFAQLVAVINV